MEMNVNGFQATLLHGRQLFPNVQRSPCPHMALVPQPHVPSVRQVLARVLGQAVQAPPFVPQNWREGVWHVAPLQHPLGHVGSDRRNARADTPAARRGFIG